MKRRSFLKKLPFAMSAPFALAGIPMKVMGETMLTKLIRSADSANDKVLIILQLHGGNDGMNMLIPVEQYDLYYSRRPNIAIPAKNSLRKYIPLDTTLPMEQQVGLHPDMQAIKGLYDTGLGLKRLTLSAKASAVFYPIFGLENLHRPHLFVPN